MATILNLAIMGFSHLIFSSQTDSHLPGLVPTICTKKTTLTFPSPPFAQKILHSFILTQLDDGSHLEFYHVGLKNFTHWYWLNLMMAAILNSAMLDSDTLFSSLRFTQKHSPSTLTLTQTNSNSNSFILTQLDDGNHLEFGHHGFSHLSFSSQTHSHLPRWVPTICTKKPSLIHSDSICWWQPPWILPCWIQTPSYLLSDSLKNTLTPLWLLTQTNSIWLKLIHSHSTWWWQPSWILPSWIWPSWIQPS